MNGKRKAVSSFSLINKSKLMIYSRNCTKLDIKLSCSMEAKTKSIERVSFKISKITSETSW